MNFKRTGGGQRKFTLSTAPKMKETHWAQTLFYFDEPLPVEQDDIIQGKIAVKMNKENRRWNSFEFV